METQRESVWVRTLLWTGALVIAGLLVTERFGRGRSIESDDGRRSQRALADTVDAAQTLSALQTARIDSSGTAHAESSRSVNRDSARTVREGSSRYSEAGLIDAKLLAPELLVDLKYAGSDNLIGRVLYSDLENCYLRPEAARMLARADSILRSKRPNLRLLLFDCVRPLDVQRRLWDEVRGTSLQRYVADPSRGSMHNYGTAVDLTLATREGQELDMGTPYDSLGPASQPREEERLFREGQLTEHHLVNRRLLRSVMKEAGFRSIEIEWWHFEAFDKETTRRQFTLIP